MQKAIVTVDLSKSLPRFCNADVHQLRAAKPLSSKNNASYLFFVFYSGKCQKSVCESGLQLRLARQLVAAVLELNFHLNPSFVHLQSFGKMDVVSGTSGAAGAGSAGGQSVPAAERPAPNILICGTPGTGKTTLAQTATERTGMKYINVGDVIKEKAFHAGKDAEFDTLILDQASEDKLLDELEPVMGAGGNIVEYHSVDFFPERWFDLVLVLRTNNTVLFDRLTARGYSGKKIEENVSAEIFGVVAEEARESYDENIVHELASDSMGDVEASLARIAAWLAAWHAEHSGAAAAPAGGAGAGR